MQQIDNILFIVIVIINLYSATSNDDRIEWFSNACQKETKKDLEVKKLSFSTDCGLVL